MRNRTYPLALMLLFCTSTLLADNNILMDDASDDIHWQPEEPFKEGKTALPEKIDLDDLQAFQVGANDPRFQYFIERGSLQTGGDKVTRFVVVIRSRTGATNTSYEAFRCGERLFKVYGYGSDDKLFAATKPEWRTIPKDESTDYRAALYEDLICNLLTGQSNSPDAIFRAMRDNRTLAID
ncbi:MAG: CNP1-like family protein [Candidatus Thiodiazotropha sp.]